MKKIACVGYHGTGAGVIDDLFREFDNVEQGKYECESRMLQDPGCVSDLEYYLVENPHRLNSGYAIKRFLDYVKKTRRTYNKIFGSKWEQISEDYAKSLVKFEYNGYWFADIWHLNPLLRFYHLFRRALNKIKPKSLKEPSYYDYFPWIKSYHAVLTEEDFLCKTRKYVNELCAAMSNRADAEYIMLDQIMPPNSTERYLRYIDDVKVIVVDRDPRDLFISHSRGKDHVLPKDAHQFCVQYRDTRNKYGNIDSNKVMYVRFEDMIYNYEEMTKKVMTFVGIAPVHHTAPRTYFNPDRSIRGTRMWEKYPEFASSIKIIEQELPDFLYEY